MKIKKLKVPTYGGSVWVIINPSVKNAIEKVEDMTSEKIRHKVHNNGYLGYMYSGIDERNKHRVMIFLKPNATPGEVAHECKHAVNIIFSYRGIKLSLSNDEPECYLLDWMVTSVHKALKEYSKELKTA